MPSTSVTACALRPCAAKKSRKMSCPTPMPQQGNEQLQGNRSISELQGVLEDGGSFITCYETESWLSACTETVAKRAAASTTWGTGNRWIKALYFGRCFGLVLRPLVAMTVGFKYGMRRPDTPTPPGRAMVVRGAPKSCECQPPVAAVAPCTGPPSPRHVSINPKP